jgi:hypothetical protein
MAVLLEWGCFNSSTPSPGRIAFSNVRMIQDVILLGLGLIKATTPSRRRAAFSNVRKNQDVIEKRWRKLNRHELIQDVIAGIPFTDGVKSHAA